MELHFKYLEKMRMADLKIEKEKQVMAMCNNQFACIYNLKHWTFWFATLLGFYVLNYLIYVRILLGWMGYLC